MMAEGIARKAHPGGGRMGIDDRARPVPESLSGLWSMAICRYRPKEISKQQALPAIMLGLLCLFFVICPARHVEVIFLAVLIIEFVVLVVCFFLFFFHPEQVLHVGPPPPSGVAE